MFRLKWRRHRPTGAFRPLHADCSFGPNISSKRAKRAIKMHRLTGIYLCGALTLLSTTIARAGEGSAETSECREITARIIERTNTHFDHFSPSRGSVFFKR